MNRNRLTNGLVLIALSLSSLGSGWLAGPNVVSAHGGHVHTNDVAVVDVPGAPIGTCPHPAEGGGPADTIRIADTGNNRVQTFVKAETPVFGNPSLALGTGDGQVSGPRGIAGAPWGATYVADTGNNRVQVFDRGMNYVAQFGSAGSGNGQFSAPNGIGVDSSANIYVLDGGNNRVQRFDMNRNYLSQFGSAGNGNGQFSNANALAISFADASIYVADTGNNRVQKFDSSGAHQLNIGGLSAPAGVSVHPLNGDVYVMDSGSNTVKQYNSGGGFIRQWGSAGNGNGQFNNARGIVVSPRHGVFVMDTGNNRIQLFNYDGTFIDKWGSAGTNKGEFNTASAIGSDLRGVLLAECLVRTFSIAGNPRQLTIYYTTGNGLVGNRLGNINNPAGDNVYAKAVADWTQQAWEVYASYNLGESNWAHVSGSAKEMEVWAYDIGWIGQDGWCCGRFHYQINSNYVNGQVNGGDDRSLGEVAQHELFHSIQPPNPYFGSPGEPGWSTEGGAGNAQDKVVEGIDSWTGSRYLGLANSYLAYQSQDDIRNTAYPGALFWTYIEEQLGGASPADPGYGMSAIRSYFDTVIANPQRGLDAVDKLVRAKTSNARNLDSFWIDFSLANYARTFTGAGLRYSYVDDDAGGYGTVASTDNTLNSGSPINLTPNVKPYSAKYFRFQPTSTCRYASFDAQSDQRVGINLIDHRSGALVRPIIPFKGIQRAVTARVGGSYSGDDRMTMVLTGLANEANVTLNANCVTPTIKIVRPNSVQKGLAGPFDNPGTVVAYISVTASGGPVLGLDFSQFTAQIGGAPAAVTAAPQVDDLYALVIAAPAQGADGDYDLSVSLDHLVTDTQSTSVRYTSQINDNMLVIDRSGSMADFNKMDAAKTAARLEITEMDRNAWSGLVSFATTPSLDWNLGDITVAPSRTLINTGVNALSAGGATAIVAGVNSGLDEQAARGDASHSCGITLLTDGMENQASDAQKDALVTRLQTLARPCPVYAIALGPDADRGLIQRFADASGGLVYPTSLSTGLLASAADTARPQRSGAIGPGGIFSASWQNRLSSFFDDISAKQAGRKRLYLGAEGVFADKRTTEFPVDASVAELVLALTGEGTIAESMKLFDPDGTLVDGTYPDTHIQFNAPHRVYRIQKPKHGTWKLEFFGQSGNGYVIMSSGQTPIALDVFARAPDSEQSAGMRVPIIGVLHNQERAIPGADVQADVQDSEGAITHLRLFDDGEHGDGNADDGVYGNWYTRANRAPCRETNEKDGTLQTRCENAFHVYAVAILGDVRREGQTSFVIQQGKDSDQDGLPDVWEVRYGLDPTKPNDTKADLDKDGALLYEEFQYGTDPNDPDSDNGGESDGSEIHHGRDPLSPSDDALRRFFHFDIRALNHALVLSYGVDPAYTGYMIYRRLVPTATVALRGAAVNAPQVDDWQLITTTVDVSGVYTDATVLNDQPYAYQVVPVGAGGELGAAVQSFAATARADDEPPEGWIHINDGGPTTASKRVTLQLGWSPDAVAMRVSNDPNLSDDAWQTLAMTRTWDLDVGLQTGDTARVYVQFRDAAGNESPLTRFAAVELTGATIYLPMLMR